MAASMGAFLYFVTSNLSTFHGIFCTLSAILYGAYHFACCEEFDQKKVDRFLQKNGAKNGPFVIGHRGSMLEAPENTLAGFRHAAENGADAVEFDVDFTKDGHAVVIHDATVDRTTNGSGRVSDFTLEDIRKLNALGDVTDIKNRYLYTNCLLDSLTAVQTGCRVNLMQA